MIAGGGGNARGRGRVEGSVELRHNGGVKIAPPPTAQDARTRDRVCRAVLEQGPVTATALAERVRLPAAGARRAARAHAAGRPPTPGRPGRGRSGRRVGGPLGPGRGTPGSGATGPSV